MAQLDKPVKRNRSASTLRTNNEGPREMTFQEESVIFIKAEDGIPRWERVGLHVPRDSDEAELLKDQVSNDDLQRLVEGYVESARVTSVYKGKRPANIDDRHLQIYINDSGVITDLPENKFAAEHGASPIYGNVVITIGASGGRSVRFTRKDLALLPTELVPK